ncbi:MAG: hypothetical protein PHH59_06925 [Methylovulum sp.]|uniref:hypothetical protein n=1 Tax=Methylovulum sp. TaxID=1916980 RepID=UPI00261E0215|nr:hypothetical protein [Methylovulum sp.]MDD2723740.1 hypothetical protein [Methylovulum sp.]MDD5125357.1 hypothetical protein [Methylovulum sp.]
MRWLKRIAWFLLILTLLLVGGTAFIWYQAFEPFYRMGKAMTYNDLPHKPTVGDLGGIPIAIPPGIARFVEYQDDPHFLTPRKGPPPVRTLQSKFRSFGFEVRYPDMALVHDETPEQRRKINIYNTMWLDVGADDYVPHDAGSLTRILEGTITTKWPKMNDGVTPIEQLKDKHGYRAVSETLYDLGIYEVYGYEKSSHDHDIGDKNIYYHRNRRGEVDTYIECSNANHHAAPCNQQFLLPKAKNIMLDVHYRIGLLPHWKDIQDRVSATTLGFATKPQADSSVTPATTSSPQQNTTEYGVRSCKITHRCFEYDNARPDPMRCVRRNTQLRLTC